MYHISFVILHYLSFEVTSACIDSICATYPQTASAAYHIIVVDNASPNDSYQQLLQAYHAAPQITLLHSDRNLGFAKGNNLGYRYALETFHSDFVIIANNDTEFLQPSFLQTMIQTYEKRSCALIGPDILNINGYHQDPYRPHPITDKQLSRWLRNRRLWLAFLRMDSFLHLSKHISFFQTFYQKHALAGMPLETWKEAADNVVLQGACIIFTPLFIQSFPSYAFYPGTYMYCEEDILAYLCEKSNLPIFYTPELQILHKDSASTSLSHTSQWEKDLFLTKNMVDSLKLFRKLRRQKFTDCQQ